MSLATLNLRKTRQFINNFCFFHKNITILLVLRKPTQVVTFWLFMYKILSFVKISLCSFLLLFGLRTTAQTDTEFWFVIPEVTISHQKPGAVPASFRFSSGNLATTVTISMPANSAVFPDITFNMNPYEFRIIDLSCWIVSPCTPPFTAVGGAVPDPPYNDLNLIENKPYTASGINNVGIRITSTTPITVYYEISRTNNKDIWALKGKNGLGREFYIPFQNNRENQSITPTQPYSAIDVVATADNTVVTFSLPPGLNASYGSGPSAVGVGGTLTRTLNRGQTFSLFPLNYSRTAANRLRGVRITSTKNIAVNVKDDSFFHTRGTCYDLAGDQLVPTNIIGKEYIVIRTDLFKPLNNDPNPSPISNEHDHIYILATQDNTTITIYNPDGSIPATTTPGIPYTNVDKPNPYTLNARQQLYVRLPAPLDFYRVVSDKPVYVWHIGGFGCEQGGAILPPIDKCTGVPRVAFARTSNETFYMIMMVRKGAENNFRFMVQDPANSGIFVDKTLLLQAPISLPFVPVVDSEWSVRRFGPFTTAQIPVTSHYMENSEDIFHLGIVNGERTSGCFYGYFSDYNEFNPGTFVVETGAPGGKICSGDSRQLYAKGGTKYKWTPSTFLDFDDIPTPLASNITSSIEYIVKVSGACKDSANRIVQIKVGGPVYVDFESDITEGCATKANPAADPALPVNFTSLSTGEEYRKWFYKVGTGGWTLFAERTDVDPPDFAINVNYSFPNTTADTLRYYILLQAIDATGNCSQEMIRSILVYPFIDVNPTRTPNNGCHPLAVAFTANPVGNVGSAKYNWEFGDFGSSNAENPPHTYNNFSSGAITYNPTVTLTDRFNYCRVTKSVSVTVQPYIKASFVIDQPEGCTSVAINVINNSQGGITATGYDWDRDGVPGYEITGTGAAGWSQTYTNTNTDNTQRIIPISLRVRNAGGCTDVFTRNVTVNPRATASISSSNNSDPNCAPLSVNLSSTTTNATFLNWSVDGVGISNSASTDYIFDNYTANHVDRLVTFTATNQWGCAAPTQQLTVRVNPFVAAIIALDTEEGCTPLPVNFTNASSIGSSVIEWRIDGTVQLNPNSQSPFVNATTTNEVRNVLVTLTARNGAGCEDIDTRTIKVNPRAISSFTYTLRDEGGTVINPADPLCSPVYASFDGQTVNANIFHWQFGDLGASVDEDPDFVLNNLTDAVKPVVVELNANNQYNCPAVPASATFNIRPEIRANFNLSNSIGCPPLTFIVEAPPTFGDYEWNYNGDLYTGNYHEFSILENKTGATQLYNIFLSATDKDGICRAQSGTRTITVYPEVEPKWNLPDIPEPSCSPYNFAITNQSTLYNSATTLSNILWEISDGAGYNTSSTDQSITRELINGNFESAKDFSLKLTATSSDGCRDEKISTITVWPPVKSVFTVDYIEKCTPMVMLFNNASLAAPGSTYTWNFDGGTATPTGGENYSVTYSNTNPNDDIPVWVTLNVQNTFGCSDDYDFLFSVLPEVHSLFALAGGSERYHCGNGGVTFTNNSSGGNLYYYWEYGDGQHFATTSNASVNHMYDNATSVDVDFNVKLTATNIFDCEDEYELPITVHPRVVANFSYTIPDLCAYPLKVDFVNASVYSIAQSGVETSFEWNYGFTWEGVDQQETRMDIQPHSYFFYNNEENATSTYNITLTSSQTHSNSGLTCPDQTSRPLTVYPELIANFSATERGCNPLTVTFQNLSQGVVTGSYLWDFGNNAASNDVVPASRVYSHTNKNASEFYTVNLDITNPLGCKKSATQQVEVYPLVVSEFVVDEGLSGCTDLTITAKNTSISSQYNYVWAFGDNRPDETTEQPYGTGKITYSNKTKNPPVIEYPLLRLTASYINDASCTHSTSKLVTVYPHVYPDFSTDFDGCHPHDVVFQNLTDVFSPNTQYRWNLGNGLTSDQYEPSAKFVNTDFFDDVEYVVRLDATSEHGCTDFVQKVVTVHPRPRSKLEIAGEYSSCPPFEAEFRNLSVGSNLTFTYNFGDGTDSVTTSIDTICCILSKIMAIILSRL